MINRDRYNKDNKKKLIERLNEEGDNVDGTDDAGEISLGSTVEDQNEESETKKVSGRRYLIWLIPVLLVALTTTAFFLLRTRPERQEYIIPRFSDSSSADVAQDVPVADPVSRCRRSNAEKPEINAKSYVVVYSDDFQVALQKDSGTSAPFASIVKILGSLVALDYYDLDQQLALKESVDAQGNGLDLGVGETLSVEDLMGAALIGSKNDAMYVLAQNYPGGQHGFLTAMQEKSRVIGLSDTSVVNVIGLDSSDQYSTPMDIAVLSIVAMRNPVIAGFAGRSSYSVTTSTGRTESFASTNPLLGNVDGVIGLKTGYTLNAGLCLVTYVDDKRDFVVVVLNAEDRGEESRKIIEWVRSNYECN
ncbi:D-alanyl-D-alanine carboxypeptidase [Candidatus Dojkabacteria bacterium]|nr:D-alanyl-D-alanine carboxypeptidase [Candidatus Dojkabacteria bacterium]